MDPADPDRDGSDLDDPGSDNGNTDAENTDDRDGDDDEVGDEVGDDDPDGEAHGTVWGEFPSAGWVCTDADTHGHLRRWAATGGRGSEARPRLAEMTPAEADAARADRRDVIESNKAWRSAETVRRTWVRTLLTRRTPPKDTAAFVAMAIACDADTVTRVGGHQLAADLLGCAPFTGYGRNPAVARLVGQASDGRAQVLTLALVLGGYEDATHTGSWRRVDPGTTRYLSFLAACGYGLSDVERRACGQDPATAETGPDREV